MKKHDRLWELRVVDSEGMYTGEFIGTDVAVANRANDIIKNGHEAQFSEIKINERTNIFYLSDKYDQELYWAEAKLNNKKTTSDRKIYAFINLDQVSTFIEDMKLKSETVRKLSLQKSAFELLKSGLY